MLWQQVSERSRQEGYYLADNGQSVNVNLLPRVDNEGTLAAELSVVEIVMQVNWPKQDLYSMLIVLNRNE